MHTFICNYTIDYAQAAHTLSLHMHTYIHTYIHTCISQYMCTKKNIHTNTYKHTHIYANF